MIRLMCKNLGHADLLLLRDCLMKGYIEATDHERYTQRNIISKDFANCLSWLEDQIAKEE